MSSTPDKLIQKIYKFYLGNVRMTFQRTGTGNGSGRSVRIDTDSDCINQLGMSAFSCGEPDLHGESHLAFSIFGDWEWDVFVMMCHFVAAHHKNVTDEIVNPPKGGSR